jgi:hypothetical protein
VVLAARQFEAEVVHMISLHGAAVPRMGPKPATPHSSAFGPVRCERSYDLRAIRFTSAGVDS